MSDRAVASKPDPTACLPTFTRSYPADDSGRLRIPQRITLRNGLILPASRLRSEVASAPDLALTATCGFDKCIAAGRPATTGREG